MPASRKIRVAFRVLHCKHMKFFLSVIFTLAALGPLARAGGSSFAVLDEMNLARTNPSGYACRLAENGVADARSTAEAISFLQKTRPLPPLAFADGLALSAGMHVAEQGERGATGHGNLWSRMARFGHFIGSAGENISYGHADARAIVAQLIIDAGVPGRGHRKNIFSSSFGVAGAAVGRHARYGAMCVIDFADAFETKGIASAASARIHGS